jgi:hypothetical protein
MRHPAIVTVILGSLLLAVCGCTLPLRSTLEKVVEDYQSPKPACNFKDGSGIAATTVLVYTFTKTIDTATFVLGGSMAAESDGGTWSRTVSADDTLTVKPKTQWSMGSNKTLTVDCADAEGFTAKESDFTYGVLDGNVYVHGGTGSDVNPGTSDLPKKSIQPAVDTAAAAYAAAEVRVAAGDYPIHNDTEFIVMEEGISLMGGYSATDWTSPRDPAAHATAITDGRATGSNIAIAAGEVTDVTVIDGFTITAGNGDASVAVYCVSGSPTIRNNTIVLGGAASPYGIIAEQNSAPLIANNVITCVSSAGMAKGIACDTSAPRIRNNHIYNTISAGFACIYNSAASPEITGNTLQVGSITDLGYGIMNVSGSDPLIRNNTIDGGLGATAAASACTAIFNLGSSPTIQNNTILAGTWFSSSFGLAIGICNYQGANPVIENNIIFSGGPSASAKDNHGIHEKTTDAVPVKCNNNYFYVDGDALYYSAGTTVTYSTEATMQAYLVSKDCPSTLNVRGTDNPEDVLEADWSVGGTTPASIKEGGLNLSADFSRDKAGNLRPATGPWSIGAYQ